MDLGAFKLSNVELINKYIEENYYKIPLTNLKKRKREKNEKEK